MATQQKVATCGRFCIALTRLLAFLRLLRPLRLAEPKESWLPEKRADVDIFHPSTTRVIAAFVVGFYSFCWSKLLLPNLEVTVVVVVVVG